MKQTYLFLVCVALFSCKTKNEVVEKKSGKEQETSLMWVADMKVDCMGEGPMKCLMIQHGEGFEEKNWRLFYDDIKGFKHEAGYRQLIEVIKKELPQGEVPADASSIQYEFVKSVKKEKVGYFADFATEWKLQNLTQSDIKVADFSSVPVVKIDPNTFHLTGTDGCNRVNGKLKFWDDKSMLFDNVLSTRKLCHDIMPLANEFQLLLRKVRFYTVKDNKLSLMDAQQKVLMELVK